MLAGREREDKSAAGAGTRVRVGESRCQRQKGEAYRRSESEEVKGVMENPGGDSR